MPEIRHITCDESDPFQIRHKTSNEFEILKAMKTAIFRRCRTSGTTPTRYKTYSRWNQFGDYGSNFARYSAFNNFSSTAPVIFANTQALAFLSSNVTLSPRLDSTYLLNLLEANGCRISR